MTQRTLGVIADPGVPIRMACALLSDLVEELLEETGEQWNVDLSQHRLPLGDHEEDRGISRGAA